MTKLPAKREQHHHPLQLRPSAMSPTMRSGLDRLTRHTHPEGNGVYSMTADVAPTDSQRLALCVRRDELSRAIIPGDHNRIRVAIAAVAGMMPSPGTDSDPAAVVDAYCACFADLPVWAVEETCAAALRGKVGATGGRFRPAPGEMHIYAERLRDVYIREKLDIDRVLNARIERPRLSLEERRAVVARVKDIMKPAVEHAST